MIELIKKMRLSLKDSDCKAINEVKKMTSEIASMFPVCISFATTERGRLEELERTRNKMHEIIDETFNGLKRFSSVEDAESWGDLVQQSIEVMTARINANRSMEEYCEKKTCCLEALKELEERIEERN